MQRESIVFYKSWVDATLHLTPEERGAALCAIVDYAIYGQKPRKLSGAVLSIFTLARPLIDANNKRFANGCRGGAPKGICNNPNGRRGSGDIQETNQELTKNKPRINQEQTKNKPNDKCIMLNDKLYKENSIKESGGNGYRFIPPTVGEVKDYILSKGYHVNAEEFVAFYESKGWMVGKNKMKDWRAAVRTWEVSRKRNAKSNPIHFAGEDDKSVYNGKKEQEYWGQ